MVCRHSASVTKRCCCPKTEPASGGSRVCATKSACCEISSEPARPSQQETSATSLGLRTDVLAPAWLSPAVAPPSPAPRYRAAHIPLATPAPPYLTTLHL